MNLGAELAKVEYGDISEDDKRRNLGLSAAKLPAI